MSSKIISETFYGRRVEPPWLLERPKEHQSHFDPRGCVRQIKSVSDRRTTTRPSENELPVSRSRAGSYFPELPSLTADRRAVTVYNALPSVTHRAASNTSFNIPIVEFSVPLCCGKCEEKVKEELENDEGVYKVVCDLHNQRVTVSSSRDPNWLLRRIQRMKKNSHFWSLGSTHFKDAHYLATSFPGPLKSSAGHLSRQELSSQQIDIPAYREIESALAHPGSLTSPRRHLNPRFVAPRSPVYDDDDREYYYHHRGAEYQFRGSEHPYDTSYDPAHVYDATIASNSFTDSLHHDHFPSSYGQDYATDDYALHLTGYY